MADHQVVDLHDLDEAGIRKLAVLHHSVMHTLLSDLGLPIVLKYYQTAYSDSSVVGLCMLDLTSGKVSGWAVGSPHPDRINARLHTPLPWFASQMFRLAFTRPFVLLQLISSVFASSTDMEMKSNSIELTYIGVASDQRGRGLGKELLDGFIQASRLKDHDSVVLSVEVENKPAISLYEKSGFRIAKTFSEGRYRRHRMEFNI